MWITKCVSIFLITALVVLNCKLEAASLHLNVETQEDGSSMIDAHEHTPVCKTVSGKTCNLPFIWKGKLYKTCTEDEHSGPWCSTLVDGSNVHVTGEWDDCSKSCRKEMGPLYNMLPNVTAILDGIGLARKHFDDDGEEATIEDAPSSSNVEAKDFDNENASINETPPAPRSAQSFYLNPNAPYDMTSAQLTENQVPLAPRSTQAFQYVKPNVNHDPRSGKLISPEEIQNLIGSVKELCFLVGSCQHYPIGGCQFDLRRHGALRPAYQPYGPPTINPYAFPQLSLRNEYAPTRPYRGSNLNLKPKEEDNETEDYSYFSRSFGNPADWDKDTNDVSSNDDVEIHQGEVDEETRQEMDQMFQVLSNEVNITPEFSDNFPTSREKRSIVAMPYQFPNMDPFLDYNQMPGLGFVPEYMNDVMFHPVHPDYIFPPLNAFPQQRCNCNCNSSENEVHNEVDDLKRFENSFKDAYELENSTKHDAAHTNGTQEGKDREKRSAGYGGHSHGVNPFYLYSRLAHHYNKHNKGSHHGGYGSYGPYIDYGNYGTYGDYGIYGPHEGYGNYPYNGYGGNYEGYGGYSY